MCTALSLQCTELYGMGLERKAVRSAESRVSLFVFNMVKLGSAKSHGLWASGSAVAPTTEKWEVARIYSLSLVPFNFVTGKSKKLEFSITLFCTFVKKKK